MPNSTLAVAFGTAGSGTGQTQAGDAAAHRLGALGGLLSGLLTDAHTFCHRAHGSCLGLCGAHECESDISNTSK